MFLGLALIIVRQKRFKRYRLFGRLLRADWPRLVELWRLGIPIAIMFTLESMVFYAAVMMMGIIGETSVAAHAIAIQIASIKFMVLLGLGQRAPTRWGLSAGRGAALTPK